MRPFPWKEAYQMLADNMAIVVATIVSHEGSTPRTSGTKMIVTGDGKIVGTIGGGLLEARVMDAAVNIINEQGASTFMPFDLSHEEADSMDMICGGRAEIFLDYISPTPENIGLFKQWHLALEEQRNGCLVTAVAADQNGVDRVHHGVVSGKEIVGGGLKLSPGALETISRKARTVGTTTIMTVENFLVIIEPAVRPMSAFLFGAGHVAMPTAHLCALVGFHVTVLDDRDAFANAERFPDAHDIQVIENFESALDRIEVDSNSFIVIFTRGHLHDQVVLGGALKTRAGYIGMIGSRNKRDAIYKALLKAGFGQRDIDRVHSPIGLPIGAKSPEEIAVSIVAEMIQERERMKRG